MKVIIVDSYPLFQEGVIKVLSLKENIEVVGVASRISEALKLMQENHPDLALIDIALSEENGLDLIKKCKNDFCKFIVLTHCMELASFKEANTLGAYAYVLKKIPPKDLLTTIELVENGVKYFDPYILQHLLANKPEHKLDHLTQREIEVLRELAHGHSNRKIAQNLFIAECTVKKHVSQILGKLSLRDRTQAALYAHNKQIM